MSGTPPLATFANHRGVVPMLAVFATLAVIELVTTHLFVALKWPQVAWPLSIATALTIAWLVRWIVGWKHRPHELHADRLRLHMGSLHSVDVPLADIAGVSGAISDTVLKRAGTRNLVPIAYPNRLLELSQPLPDRRATHHVAIRVDDPPAFDAALREAGIVVAT